MSGEQYCLTKGLCDPATQFASLVGTNACNPSVLAVSQGANGYCASNLDTCSDGCLNQGYGRSLPPPCGLNTGGNCGTGCCWDSTLCFPVNDVCQSGENTVTIPKFGQAPTISSDTSIALCIWNYTVQNVISKILKFVASYYDWLYCQIGLYNYNRFVLNTNPNASSDPTVLQPTNQQIYSDLASATGFNEQSVNCGEGFRFAPQTFTINNSGNVVNVVACANLSDLGDFGTQTIVNSGVATGTQAENCQNNGCSATNPSSDRVPTFREVYGRGLANNPGNAYTPPARLSSQVYQWFGWAESTLDDLDIANCVCGNLCNFLQMLINVDSSSSVIRNFVLNSTFTGPSSVNQPTQLGCGNLYGEHVLVDGVANIVGILDLMSEVFKSLGISSGGEDGEALLQKFCGCLINAASGGTACSGQTNFVTASNPPTVASQFSTECWAQKNTIYLLETSSPGNLVLNPQHNYQQSLNVIQYQEVQYRMQFFAALTDLLQYVLFDRDCDFPEDDDCASCAAPTAEDWLTYRCKKGTGDGNCVVCSGACAGFRRKDDFNPLTSVIAVRYWLALLGLDRSDVAGSPTYCQQVDSIYNEAVTAIYNAYKDTDGDINFVPDCGAPQFCCTTNLAASSCSYDCCSKSCSGQQGCLLPVPALDTRKAGYTCGGCGSAPYTPALGNCFDVFCLGNTDSGTSEEVTDETGQFTVGNWACYANPCVTVPYCCNTVSCAQDSGCNMGCAC